MNVQNFLEGSRGRWFRVASKALAPFQGKDVIMLLLDGYPMS
jgi:hypothetical protein